MYRRRSATNFLRRRGFHVIYGAILIGLVGTAIVLRSFAANSTAAFEAESGVRSAGVASASSAQAAGGNFVAFAGSIVRPSAQLTPRSGALLGAFSDTTHGTTIGVLEDAAHLNRLFDISNHYSDFDTSGSGLIAHLSRDAVPDIAAGRIPIITWQMHRYSQQSYSAISDVIAGNSDTYLQNAADALKQIGKPVMLRLGHEMNGSWYSWSGCNKDAATLVWTCRSAADYIAAWQHIHDIFEARGATNAVWVWCPAGYDVPKNLPGHHWTDYYPGDEYVDWVCIDQYSQGANMSLSMTIGTAPGTSVYGDYAKRKPFMIGETMNGPAVGATNQYTNKTAYFNNMITDLKANLPYLQALVFFDSKGTGDYRINSTPETMQAFINMGKNCYFDPLGKQPECR